MARGEKAGLEAHLKFDYDDSQAGAKDRVAAGKATAQRGLLKVEKAPQ